MRDVTDLLAEGLALGWAEAVGGARETGSSVAKRLEKALQRVG
jgi:hypothetical protein